MRGGREINTHIKGGFTITLTGEDALTFANSIFIPTKEEVERREAVIERISREVTIMEQEDGFSADVSWLDLSFLRD